MSLVSITPLKKFITRSNSENLLRTSIISAVAIVSFQVRNQKKIKTPMVPIPAANWLSVKEDMNIPHEIREQPNKNNPRYADMIDK